MCHGCGCEWEDRHGECRNPRRTINNCVIMHDEHESLNRDKNVVDAAKIKALEKRCRQCVEFTMPDCFKYTDGLFFIEGGEIICSFTGDKCYFRQREGAQQN